MRAPLGKGERVCLISCSPRRRPALVSRAAARSLGPGQGAQELGRRCKWRGDREELALGRQLDSMQIRCNWAAPAEWSRAKRFIKTLSGGRKVAQLAGTRALTR